MIRHKRTWYARFGVALISVAAAILLRLLLSPMLGDAVPFIFQFPVVVLSSWYGGLGPGLLSVGLSAAAAWYFFLLPNFSSAPVDPLGQTRLVAFGCASLLIVLLAEDLHRARRRIIAGEKKAREQAERLAAIVESSSDAIISSSGKEGIITSWNSAAERIFGYTAAEALEQPISLIFPVEQRAREQRIRDRLQAGELVEPYEAVYQRKDGTGVEVSLSVSVIRDEGGQIIGVSHIARDIRAQRQKEQALAESELQRQLALSAARLGTFDWHLEAEHIQWNVAQHQIFGTDPASFQPRLAEVWERVHIEDREKLEAIAKEALESGAAREAEFRIVRQNGEVRWCICGIAATVDAKTKALRISGVTYDITDRKRMEEALRNGEARLAAAMEIAQLGIWEYDPVAGVTRWDRRCSEVFGTAEGHPLRNEEVFALLHLDDRPRIEAAVGAALDPLGTGHYDVEYRVIRPDGELRWVAVRGNALMTGEGAGRRLELFVGTLMDITEMRRTERELRESEAHFRGLANAMPQLVWTARSDSSVSYYNLRSKQYSSISAEAEGSWSWQSIIHEEDLQRTLEIWQAAVQSSSIYECEHRVRMADGTFRWHLSRAVPLLDEARQIVKWFGTATDINDLRRIQQELRDNDRRKDEFLAMLAHELRNPLAPIRNAASVLRYLGADKPQIEQMRQIIERQTEHLTRIVDDLLDVSRITRGKVTLQRQTLSLLSFISRAVETSRPLIDASRHKLVVSLPSKPVHVDGDLTRLAQVISNLLNNAAKYTTEGGHIELVAERAGDEILISIADNGIGISKELIPNIFDLFAQADCSLDRAQGGLGIGLTVVKRMVEMHGGRVEVHSDGIGKGSRFTVCLPVLAEAATSTRAADEPSAKGGSSGPEHGFRVLVVDDNKDSAESLALLLELGGYAVRRVYDGKEALDVAAEFLPHAVLLDIGLPGMNGYKVAQLLRQRDETKRALLIALTGYGQEADRQLSRDAGFDHHLTKPVAHEHLSSLLKSLAPDC